MLLSKKYILNLLCARDSLGQVGEWGKVGWVPGKRVFQEAKAEPLNESYGAPYRHSVGPSLVCSFFNPGKRDGYVSV